MRKLYYTVTTVNDQDVGIDSVACWDRIFTTEQLAIASVMTELKEMLDSPYGFEGREDDSPIRFCIEPRSDASILITCDGLLGYVFIIQTVHVDISHLGSSPNENGWTP
jgi:hypothetical protein